MKDIDEYLKSGDYSVEFRPKQKSIEEQLEYNKKFNICARCKEPLGSENTHWTISRVQYPYHVHIKCSLIEDYAALFKMYWLGPAVHGHMGDIALKQSEMFHLKIRELTHEFEDVNIEIRDAVKEMSRQFSVMINACYHPNFPTPNF